MIELKDGTHVIALCPTGWGIPVSDIVEAAREIVDYVISVQIGTGKLNLFIAFTIILETFRL